MIDYSLYSDDAMHAAWLYENSEVHVAELLHSWAWSDRFTR